MPKVEIDLPDIEGFEYTGEYRAATIGEYILNNGTVYQRNDIPYTLYEKRHILRKKKPEPWKPTDGVNYFYVYRDGDVDYCYLEW